jgi:hypothetical protein
MKTFLVLLFTAFGIGAYAQEKLKSEGDIPIIAWYSIPEKETSAERFVELREAGFHISLTFYSNIEAVEKALDAAQKAGVKILAACPELKTEPETTVKRLMKHPALAGYHLRDEPFEKDFPELAEWTKRIQAIDSKHYCYINLIPNHWTEALGGKSYRRYLETFIEQVPVPMLSFDNYPVRELADGRTIVKEDWYKNLEIIRDVGQKAGLPVWAFAMATSHLHRDYLYPVPTIAQLKLQMFSNLAYGAQALQYFTYWIPDEREFYQGSVTLDGKRTDIYDRVKALNSEIRALSGVFFGAKAISVQHTGAWIPVGTKRLTTLPTPVRALETDGNAIVSLLEKKDRYFLVVVNRSLSETMKLMLVADHYVKKVLKDGALVPASAYIPVTEVNPGDMVIYSWEKKDLEK